MTSHQTTQTGDCGADDRLGTDHVNWLKALVKNSSWGVPHFASYDKAFATWIENGGGGSIPTSLSSHLSKMIATVTESVPVLQHHGDRFSALGWFHTFQIRARRRLDGACVAAVPITKA